MNFNQFNFSDPHWLWGLAVIPLFYFFSRAYAARKSRRKMTEFADAALLPHLFAGHEGRSALEKVFMTWAAIWSLGILALAGPRWSFHEIPTYKPPKKVVVALDLASSMNQTDVKPSRLERAKERIADLLHDQPDVAVGLVAFARDAHMVTPITEDRATLNHLLPALQSDLITVPGRSLTPALELGRKMLNAAGGGERAIVVMSDGPFQNSALASAKASLEREGIRLDYVNFDGSPGTALSTTELFGAANWTGAAEASGLSTRDWEPRFYICLIPAMLLGLLFFRRRRAATAMTLALAAFSLTPRAQASEVGRYFQNRDQRGQSALEKKDFAQAAQDFTDPYRRGVAEYRAGNYAAAADAFAHSSRPEVAADAKYNLGNALANQGKYPEAIAAYKESLHARPGFDHAEKNLRMIEDLMKKQPPPPQQQQQAQNNQKQNSQGQGQGQAKNQKSQKQNSQGQGQGQDQSQAKNQKDQNGKSGAQNQAANAPPASAKPGADDAGQKQKVEPAKPNAGQSGEDQAAKAEAKNESQKSPTAAGAPGEEQKTGGEKGDRRQASRPGPDDQKKAREYKQDVDADQWLNLVRNDPHAFLRNQFMIESARAQAQTEE